MCYCSLARDPIITTTLQVYGVAAVPETSDPDYGHLVIITEIGIKNTLQLYQTEGRSIPLHVTYDLWSRLASALHCIHHKRIIHQDLKPENILVTQVGYCLSFFDVDFSSCLPVCNCEFVIILFELATATTSSSASLKSTVVVFWLENWHRVIFPTFSRLYLHFYYS